MSYNGGREIAEKIVEIIRVNDDKIVNENMDLRIN